jgi:hypothetical protein
LIEVEKDENEENGLILLPARDRWTGYDLRCHVSGRFAWVKGKPRLLIHECTVCFAVAVGWIDPDGRKVTSCMLAPERLHNSTVQQWNALRRKTVRSKRMPPAIHSFILDHQLFDRQNDENAYKDLRWSIWWN